MCCDKETNEGGCCGNSDCCGGGSGQSSCVCAPYKSGLLMTAQIVSILALVLSWLWWLTFVLSFPTMIVLQVVWCCRMSKAGIIATGVMSTLTCLLSIFAGVWALLEWKDQAYCKVWTLLEDDDYYYYYDPYYYDDIGYNETAPTPKGHSECSQSYYYDSLACFDWCDEKAWAILAFFDAGLWMLVAAFIWIVLCCGKFDQMRDETMNNNNNNQQQQAVPHQQQQQQQQHQEIELGQMVVAPGIHNAVALPPDQQQGVKKP